MVTVRRSKETSSAREKKSVDGFREIQGYAIQEAGQSSLSDHGCEESRKLTCEIQANSEAKKAFAKIRATA